ncbi:MAG: hypothetical protein ABSF54_24260, partial [Bryobacteraceae bacterium]
MTNEKEIPLLGPILAKIQLLQTDLNTLSHDLQTAENAFNKLLNDFETIVGNALSALQNDLKSIANGFSKAAQDAMNSLSSLFGISGIISAFQNFNVTNPTTYGSLPAAISTLGNIGANDLVGALNDITNAVNGVANQNAGIIKDLPALAAAIQTVNTDATNLVTALETVSTDMAGPMADLLNPTDVAENLVDSV